MKPRNTFLSELDTPPQSSSSPNPNSLKLRPLWRHKLSKENNPPPIESNFTMSNQKPSPAVPKIRSQLPPRPPLVNPLKRKLCMETIPEDTFHGSLDSGVKVVVRMRPTKDENEGETIVKRISSASLSINGQAFTFDSVADTDATQQDIFQLIGEPLVENCLAGFNSSIFAYGQTGSGKTYTMWGPTNSLLDKNLGTEQQGLTPRVFQRLFARIDEEQTKHTGKLVNYRCRCSFLEIYNEQITDLLDPNQKNLQVREDIKSGIYVENLSEGYVCTTEDVTQLLIKGLSNRRTGATSLNAESSRSHSIFTCVVESQFKNVADGISTLKTSRINLVDLAGSERQKLTGAAGERLKEAGNINRSLSQLGNLINILAEVSQTGKQRHIPYRDSRLTFLLQESLGGNARLAMVCAISPVQSCKNETFSTLRFAQRAKAMKNKAVLNEVMHEDVKDLRQVIGQLKEELHRMKANGNNNSTDNKGYSTEWARRSLNLLKLSLNRPIMLPYLDEEDDVEMEIVEEAVEKSCIQADEQSDGNDDLKRASERVYPVEQVCEHTDVNMEEELAKEIEKEEMMISDCGKPVDDRKFDGSDVKTLVCHSSVHLQCGSEHFDSPPSLSIAPSNVSPVLYSPTPSILPTIGSSRKSLRTSWALSASQKDLKDDTNLAPECLYSCSVKSLKDTSMVAPTENMEASLHRGLEVFCSQRQSSIAKRSALRFSIPPTEEASTFPLEKLDAAVQTLPEDDGKKKEGRELLCSNCNSNINFQEKGAHNSSNLQLVPVDGPVSVGKCNKQVAKAVEKVLAGAIRREMSLEELCAKQTAEIMLMNRLVQQHKHERKCNAMIGQMREDKLLRLESLMDDILPTKQFMEQEFATLTLEHKFLKNQYENHPETLSTKIELARTQSEVENYRNFFELGEREILLEEIQDLKNQLQFYIDSSTSNRYHDAIMHLTNARWPTLVPSLVKILKSNNQPANEKLEQERFHPIEAETKWISLAEELRHELELSKSLTEKQKQQLETEKKCGEEWQEAMQMAMQGHARMLEQYADLEEKHILLLARHRKMHEGIDDIKKAAAKAGVRGAESRFINTLAAEISALRVEREKEQQYLMDENNALKAQLKDTAEAVQAAGELLVRLKESEEAVSEAHRQAMEAKEETEKAYKHIEELKRKHEYEISKPNRLLTDFRQAIRAPMNDSSMAMYEWKEEMGNVYNAGGEDGELLKLPEPPSWFSGYDRCNI